MPPLFSLLPPLPFCKLYSTCIGYETNILQYKSSARDSPKASLHLEQNLIFPEAWATHPSHSSSFLLCSKLFWNSLDPAIQWLAHSQQISLKCPFYHRHLSRPTCITQNFSAPPPSFLASSIFLHSIDCPWHIMYLCVYFCLPPLEHKLHDSRNLLCSAL